MSSPSSSSPESVAYPQVHALREWLRCQGVPLGNLNPSQCGAAPLQRVHHISKVTLSHSTECYRVRICRSCTGQKQMIDLGSYDDMESAILINDAYEIIHQRYHMLNVLLPSDREFLSRFQVRRRGCQWPSPLIAVLQNRLGHLSATTPDTASHSKKRRLERINAVANRINFVSGLTGSPSVPVPVAVLSDPSAGWRVDSIQEYATSSRELEHLRPEAAAIAVGGDQLSECTSVFTALRVLAELSPQREGNRRGPSSTADEDLNRYLRTKAKENAQRMSLYAFQSACSTIRDNERQSVDYKDAIRYRLLKIDFLLKSFMIVNTSQRLSNISEAAEYFEFSMYTDTSSMDGGPNAVQLECRYQGVLHQLLARCRLLRAMLPSTRDIDQSDPQLSVVFTRLLTAVCATLVVLSLLGCHDHASEIEVLGTGMEQSVSFEVCRQQNELVYQSFVIQLTNFAAAAAPATGQETELLFSVRASAIERVQKVVSASRNRNKSSMLNSQLSTELQLMAVLAATALTRVSSSSGAPFSCVHFIDVVTALGRRCSAPNGSAKALLLPHTHTTLLMLRRIITAHKCSTPSTETEAQVDCIESLLVTSLRSNPSGTVRFLLSERPEANALTKQTSGEFVTPENNKRMRLEHAPGLRSRNVLECSTPNSEPTSPLVPRRIDDERILHL